MAAMSADVVPDSGGIGLLADEIARYGYKKPDEIFSIAPADAQQFQLSSAQHRFEQLAPRIAALKDQADRHRIDRIRTLNDLVPLLFSHTVLKSYPLALLEKGRFDLLTRWLDRLTPLDLASIDASRCEGIDAWLTLLETRTPLKIFHTSGTSGKLSFIPRTHVEYQLWSEVRLASIRFPFGANPTDGSGGELRLPVIFPAPRFGRYAAQQMISYLAEHFAPSPDQVFPLNNGHLSADLISLSGRVRVAHAKGELARLELSDIQRRAFRGYLDELARRPAETAEFFRRIVEELQGKAVFVSSASSVLFQAAREGLSRGIHTAFSAHSVGFTGGGGKGVSLPENWREIVSEFTGIPQSRWQTNYGMTEITAPMPACSRGHYHIPLYIVPFVLDPATGDPLPREGSRTGRFAAFDLLAQNLWGGIVSGDQVTIEWDRPCGCGRLGPHLHPDIQRYADSVTGDDKVTCANTADNLDAALQAALDSLLGS
jgi:hypothetical protein